MKNNNKSSNVTRRFAALVAIVLLAVLMLSISWKVVHTGWTLASISHEVRGANRYGMEAPEKITAQRQAMIESEDALIHWFANTNDALQALTFITAHLVLIISVGMLFLVAFYIFHLMEDAEAAEENPAVKCKRKYKKQNEEIEQMQGELDFFKEENGELQEELEEVRKELNDLQEFLVEKKATRLLKEFYGD